jgi:hypothetical protein
MVEADDTLEKIEREPDASEPAGEAYPNRILL